MKIAVLGESPAFPINIVDAFSLRHEARLFSGTPSDYRQQDAGTVLDTEANQQEARQFIATADLLFISGVSSLRCLAMLAGSDWVRWLKGLPGRFVLYIVDTPYWFEPKYWDGLVDALQPSTLFIMPDMFPLTSLKAVPLFYPHRLNHGVKDEQVTVIFSPGNKRKAETKGTAEIEEAIRSLQQDEVDFVYKRLMYETYADTLKAKGAAHIMIDRLPPMGQPDGMGNTGMEGLAAGMAVLTNIYDQSHTDPYFERPPIIDVKNRYDLYTGLRTLVTDNEWCQQVGQAGQDWLKRNFELEPWLDYVEKYL